jgi:hypothetical protein
VASNYGTQFVEGVEELNSFITSTDKEIVSVNNHGNGFIIVFKHSDPELEDWIRNIRVEPI